MKCTTLNCTNGATIDTLCVVCACLVKQNQPPAQKPTQKKTKDKPKKKTSGGWNAFGTTYIGGSGNPYDWK